VAGGTVVVVVVGATVVVVVGATVVPVDGVVVVVVVVVGEVGSVVADSLVDWVPAPERSADWAKAAWMPSVENVTTTGATKPATTSRFMNARRSTPTSDSSGSSPTGPTLSPRGVLRRLQHPVQPSDATRAAAAWRGSAAAVTARPTTSRSAPAATASAGVAGRP
jgi:hypothetical protein